ncbi:MAG TPA: D-glycero-beta-D-manno-heptose 1-phosphate adenylyltransferase [Bacteroidia bacterium]|nr:D-glycero-beta-D-manno-heptose 1-phosphate adenylyltransferase [Bacteroidia bacterium]
MHLQAISDKIFLRQQLIVWLNGMRFKNEKLVFTNGCFDLLHQGHIDYLAKAADLGTKLIVGVNSDNSVKRLGKGPSRPIQNEQSRALLLAALHFTSAITVFDEDTPYQLIELVKPNVLVKGADWKVEKIVGYDLVKANGGEVVTIEFLPGFSTTAIEDKIKSS